MCFELGAHRDILHRFDEKPTQYWAHQCRIEQTFLSCKRQRQGRLSHWPADCCLSFKADCPPGGWCFPGILLNGLAESVPARRRPHLRLLWVAQADQALAGQWPGKWYKGLKPARWIADYWHE